MISDALYGTVWVDLAVDPLHVLKVELLANLVNYSRFVFFDLLREGGLGLFQQNKLDGLRQLFIQWYFGPLIFHLVHHFYFFGSHLLLQVHLFSFNFLQGFGLDVLHLGLKLIVP